MSSEKTVRLTMAQALCRFLGCQYVEIDGEQQQFVQGMLGIFGHGNVTGIGQALEQGEGDLRFIRIHNEQAGVHTAIAYAKQTNRLGIYAVTASIGPGASNMVTGAATATVNRLPVLLLPGDIFACRQPDPVLQQTEDPTDVNRVVNDCFKPVCRYWDRIARPEQLMSAALNAMRVLTDPVETGAVCLCLPQDVQAEAYDYPEAFFKRRVWCLDRRPISTVSLQLAVEKIQSKQTPLLIAGGGVQYALATEVLRTFVEAAGIPVAETNAARGVLPWNHPLSLGGMGVMGSAAANTLAQEADLVIAVGTRLTDFTTISKGAFLNPEVEILHLNVSRFDAVKLDGLAIVADAKEGLESLTRALTAAGYTTDSAYRERIHTLKAAWDKEVDRLFTAAAPEGFLAQTAVVGALNHFIDDEDVIVCAAGSLPGDLQRLWRPVKPKTYHLEYGYSCMGYEIAGGLGVKYAIGPARQVWVLCGDGSYLMLHTELVTSLVEHQKLNIIVFDSQGFNSINNLLTGLGGTDGFGTDLRQRNPATGQLDGPIHAIDFAANARSYGAVAFAAHTMEEFKDALKRAKEAPKTTLIHVNIAKGTNSDGYASWWRVGVAETSTMPKVDMAHQDMVERIKTARLY